MRCDDSGDANLPRYFFHTRGPELVSNMLDRKGQQLPDVATAKMVAVEIARNIMRSTGRQVWSEWLFEIVDGGGQIKAICRIV